MTGLLDLMVAPPITRPVEPDGPVVREPAERLRFDGGKSYLFAEIQLHRDDDSLLWMWAVAYLLPSIGSAYQVGPKWGRFAATRADALHHARAELTAALERIIADPAHAGAHALAGRMLAWAGRLA